MFYLFYLCQLIKLLLLPALIGIIGTYYIAKSNSKTAKYLRQLFEL